MKLLKIIMNCLIAIALVLSLVLNVVLFFGYKYANAALDLEREHIINEVPAQQSCTTTTAKVENELTVKQEVDLDVTVDVAIEHILVGAVIETEPAVATNPTVDNTVEDVVEDTDEESENTGTADEAAGTVIYQDANIRVTYLDYEVKDYGPVLYFKIENLSKVALTVLCTDVYIDGYHVFTSGLTCEKLPAESETIEEFVLIPNDGTDVYDVDKVAFVIKLVNAKSYLDLYQSDYIIIEI